VANEIDYQGDLGEIGKCGNLKNQTSRQGSLENKNHKIRFLYTPRHCSWMNQIENWFGQLTAHVIIGGNFKSKLDLKSKIIFLYKIL
jgi:transposase